MKSIINYQLSIINYQLSIIEKKYFTKTELIKCFRERKEDRCPECRLTSAAHSLPNGAEAALEALVDNMLDPAREALKKPIYLTSAFRCPLHNAKVGSKPTSQHIKGEACDIYCGTPEENLELAKILVTQNNFDQMILYVDSSTSLAPRFIHVSYKRIGENRHRILKQVTGTAGYVVVARTELL